MTEPNERITESEKTVPAQMSVVTLAAGNIGELREFYRALGWDEVPGSSDEWAGFLLGGVVLALYPRSALAEETGSGMYGAGFTLAVNVDSPDKVDAAYESALWAGGGAVAEPQERRWGGRSAYFADLEGNRWEIAYNKTVVFGERGEIVAYGEGA